MSLDPRTKLITAILLIVTTFLTTQGISLFGLCCLLLISLLLSHTPFSLFLRHLVWLAWLILFTFLAHLAGHSASLSEGVWNGFFRVGQLIVAVGWGTLLGAHTTPFSVVHALEHLGRPMQRLGLPLQKLTLVTMLSLRFLPLLAQEGEQLLHAYIARGIDLTSGNLLNRLNNYGLLSIPLLTNMLRRVEHIATAMETRAYEASSERTSFRELRMHPLDYLVLAGSLLLLLLLSRLV
jgi:energy-coupling factor transport system permease protein